MYNKNQIEQRDFYIQNHPSDGPVFSARQMIDRRRNMIGLWAILILYGIIGGLSTVSMVIGIPAIIAWKIYRKIVHHIPLSC